MPVTFSNSFNRIRLVRSLWQRGQAGASGSSTQHLNWSAAFCPQRWLWSASGVRFERFEFCLPCFGVVVVKTRVYPSIRFFWVPSSDCSMLVTEDCPAVPQPYSYSWSKLRTFLSQVVHLRLVYLLLLDFLQRIVTSQTCFALTLDFHTTCLRSANLDSHLSAMNIVRLRQLSLNWI